MFYRSTKGLSYSDKDSLVIRPGRDRGERSLEVDKDLSKISVF